MTRGFALILFMTPAVLMGQRLDLPRYDNDRPTKILVSTFYSVHPDAVSSESWVACNITGGYNIGLAYAWQTRKFRPVSTVKLVDEAAWHPGLTWRSGFRSFATGRLQESATVDYSRGNMSFFAGVSLRSGFTGARGVAGGSYDFRNGFLVGLQADGRQVMTFVNYSKNGPVLGAYLVDWRHPAYLFGWRF